MGYRSLLCPVDFSEQSARALRVAHMLAERWGSRLTVLYAIDPFLCTASLVAFRDPMIDRAAAELREFLHESTGRISDPARIVCDAHLGHAADEILAAVTQYHADVIVMGTQGLTGIERWTLGSVTRDVLHRTRVPVLAIPPDEGGLALDGAWPHGCVIAAIDLRPRVGVYVATTAAAIAQWFDAALVLAHVVEDVRVPVWMQEALAAHDRIRVGKAQAAIDAIARETPAAHGATETRVLCGHPADELAALVLAERAGLLITALQRNGGLFGSRRGSLSYHVLTHAAAPVLALPWP